MPPSKTLGVAEGADRHVDPGALTGEGREIGRHHDGRDVLGVEIGRIARIDAEAFQHAFEALTRERGVAKGVTGSVEADHEAVSDELVVADALEIGNVLDPRNAEHGRSGPY